MISASRSVIPAQAGTQNASVGFARRNPTSTYYRLRWLPSTSGIAIFSFQGASSAMEALHVLDAAATALL